MKNALFIISLVVGGIVIAQFSSCKKDNFLTQGGDLSFSRDTVYFDTVFTTLGSVTHSFKIFNRSDKPVRIDNIRIEKGDQSFFRLNVDGEATKNISNVEIAANDSIYVFAAVTVDPNNDLNPFVIDDKVLIKLNEKNYNVPLQAYGQNAHILRDSVMETRTWVNDLPYVIINSALIDSGHTLTIQKGCRIYMHANSKLYVGGRLNCFGTKADSIIFQGDRLDRNYFGQDFPGEWRGLHFLQSSHLSNLNYTIIKNGGASDASVYVEPSNRVLPLHEYMLEMNNCKVFNSLGFGVLGFNTYIDMNNCLVHSCGKQNFAAVEGGRYRLNFCTIATYGGRGITHINEPVLYLSNYRLVTQTTFVQADLSARLTNCIVYGSLENEVVLDNQLGNALYDVTFDYSLIKRKDPLPTGVDNINSIINNDPLFVDQPGWDFSISSGSPAKGAGFYSMLLINDIDGNPRSNPPSMGCYE